MNKHAHLFLLLGGRGEEEESFNSANKIYRKILRALVILNVWF